MLARQLTAGFILLAGVAAAAQPAPADAVARARTLAERADTAAALALLDSAVRARPRDASAWHLRGELLWSTVRGYRNEMTDLPRIRRVMGTDSSLRLARALAPDSGRFALTLARWFRGGGNTLTRIQAGGLLGDAQAAARRANDAVVLSQALDELGLKHWAAYHTYAYRRQLDVPFPTDTVLLADRTVIPTILEVLSRPNVPPLGEYDRTMAAELFHEALQADPSSAPAARHLFMSLAEREAWEELRRAADVRLAAAPADAYAWLARGLASWRTLDAPAAATAFDSALARLGPAERARYTNVARLMTPKDSAAYVALRDESRAETERIYWAYMDPLLLTAENEHRLEYLSRVAYAELSWTSDDLRVGGASTDRGQVWTRYGPPKTVAAFDLGIANSDNALVWHYRFGKVSLDFVFRAPPGYGEAFLRPAFRTLAENIRTEVPVMWSNVAVTGDMDTVRTQVARFRAAGDSSDVVVVAGVPVGRLSAQLDVDRATIDVGLHLITPAARTVLRDTEREAIPLTGATGVHRKVWQLRLPPASFSFRVEALQREAGRAARGMGMLAVERGRGFGTSDLLVGERVAPRDSTTAARWSDLLVVPSDGVLRSGQPFGVAWETYEMGTVAGASRYRVDIRVTVIEYIRATGAGASLADRARTIAARVVGGVADAIGVSGVGTDRVSLSFTRERPASAAVLDYVTLDMGRAAAGRYRITVQTTDLHTKRSVSSEREVRIVE